MLGQPEVGFLNVISVQTQHVAFLQPHAGAVGEHDRFSAVLHPNAAGQEHIFFQLLGFVAILNQQSIVLQCEPRQVAGYLGTGGFCARLGRGLGQAAN
jgi:hypothetical protein